MSPADVDKLITETAHSILILRREGVPLTDSQAFERARDIVQAFMIRVDAAQARLRARLVDIANATLKLGAAHGTIERAADRITDQLEALLAGHECDICSVPIEKDEGAFYSAGARGIKIVCADCDDKLSSGALRFE